MRLADLSWAMADPTKTEDERNEAERRFHAELSQYKPEVTAKREAE